VASSLQRRVARLEEAAGRGPGGECLECGGPDDFGPDDTFELVWVDPDGPEEEEYCPECGRRVEIIVRFEEDL
jgi:hypothetical protein